METQLKKNNFTFDGYAPNASRANWNNYSLKPPSVEDIVSEDIVTVSEKIDAFKNLFLHNRQPGLDDLLTRIAASAGKKSFLVFKHNKYINVPTENIAFFYVKNESSIIVCLDGQEYSVNYSLEQIQNLLNGKQFYRLNRQYLVNFYAVKEVEHYFARKLLVKLTVAATDKLLVSKEKASSFLHWLENR